jgi:hypothetical protein
LTCATFFPVLANAQGTGTFDPFGVPAATILCRPISKIAVDSDSVAVQLEFRDGADPFGQRVSSASFDSVGTPRFMFIRAPRTVSDTTLRMYMMAVQFQPKRAGVSLIFPITFSSPSSDSVKRGSTIKENMTEAAISHAEELAKWFWGHRCNRASPDQ